jgi:serine phosphatase RsbU (regulator of sigma subunit)
LITLYTDGIPEAENSDKNIIGFDDGLLDLFRRAQRKSLNDTLDAVIGEVNSFRGDVPIDDDIILMGFEL